jgi:hypothetical protein
MKKPKPTNPCQEMNADELAEATRGFDNEFVIDSFSPMAPADK